MTRRKTSRIISLGASLTLALATVVLGTGPAAAEQDDDPLDAPTNLRITELSANSVTLAWDPPDGAVSYRVLALGPTTSSNQSARVDEPTATLHLRQGWTYVAEVRAYDANGQFSDLDREDRLDFTMPVDPDNPPVTAPENVRAEVEPDTLGVVVEWEPSTSAAGELSYFVMVEEVGGRTRWFEAGEQLAITLHLDLGRTYLVRVNGKDSAKRNSDWSDPVEVTTPDVPPPSAPGNVRVTTSPGSVTVEWDAPTGGAGVKHYGVMLRGAPGGLQTKPSTDTTATFEVPPGGNLNVSVSAKDWLDRWSDPSEQVEFTLEPAADWEPPSAPTNLRAFTADSGDEVIFEWDAPESGVGPFTYELFLDGVQIETAWETQLISPYFAECSHAGQMQATFVVTASSHGFESPPSEPIIMCFA